MGAGASAQPQACVEVENQGSTSYDYFVEPMRSVSGAAGGDGGGFMISELPETVILRVAPEALVLLDGTHAGDPKHADAVPRPIQHHPYHTIMCWGHGRSTFQFRITVATTAATEAGDGAGDGGASNDNDHDHDSAAAAAVADGKDAPDGAPSAGSVAAAASAPSSRAVQRCIIEEHTLRFRTRRGKEIEDRTLRVVKKLMAEMAKRALSDAEFGELRHALQARVPEALAEEVAAAAAAADAAGGGGGGGAVVDPFGGFGPSVAADGAEDDTDDGGLVGLVRGWAPTKAFIARQGVELLRWFRQRTSVFECIDVVCVLHGRLMTPSSFQLLLNEFPSREDRDNVCHRLGIKDPGGDGLDLCCPDGIERTTNHAAIGPRKGGRGKEGGEGGPDPSAAAARNRSPSTVAAAEARLDTVVRGKRHKASLVFCSSGLGLSLEARVFHLRERAESSIEVVSVDSFVEGLPADGARRRGEIERGDVLVAVNETSVVGLPLRSVTALFKDGGGQGKEMTLTVLRPAGAAAATDR